MGTRITIGLLALALTSCSGGAPDTVPTPLAVAAASDLQVVLPELAARFRSEADGPPLELIYGSSGNLARQIRQGAPFDLFLSADRGLVDVLAAEDIVKPASVRPYAVGSLVIVTPAGSSPRPPARLVDLLDPGFRRIAMANPDLAPYGRAARQALEGAGLWERLEPRIVLAETVRQALQYVETGNAEAGLVGRAIASTPYVTIAPVDVEGHDPIVQALGVVAASPSADRAEAFARFVAGPEGQAILARYGFRSP